MAKALPQVLTDSAETIPVFSHLDQHFRLKMRGFIDIFAPPFYLSLMRTMKLEALRSTGIFPIMFFLDFESYKYPLRFDRLQTPFSLSLHRYAGGQDPQGPQDDRLMVRMVAELQGQQGSGKPGALVGDPFRGDQVTFARASIVQMLTRPLAPPGERQVSHLPEEGQALAESPWTEAYPTADLLDAVPPGFTEQFAPGWDTIEGVWGMPSTDPNQHVNTQNYILGMENLGAHLLHGAGLAVARHYTSRLRTLFKKPFFVGETYRLRGRLFTQGHETLMFGHFHKPDGKGGYDERPAVVLRMEGQLE